MAVAVEFPDTTVSGFYYDKNFVKLFENVKFWGGNVLELFEMNQILTRMVSNFKKTLNFWVNCFKTT